MGIDDMAIKSFAAVFVLLAAMPVTAQETPQTAALGGVSSNVAWTPETIKMLQTADPAAGATLHDALLCSSCHGAAGIARSGNWPNLAGQIAGYSYKSLRDYHDWERSTAQGSTLMGYVVEELTDQNMADLAAWYASLPGAGPVVQTISAKDLLVGETLHWLGDPMRMIQPCSACHGNAGKGEFPDYPSLLGQTPDYTGTQLRLYKSGERHSDVYSRMRLVAAELTEAEIDALASYYASLGQDGVPQN
jgi:cytochrome c553